jgi:effector-binding domain-containing protein
MTDKKKKMKLTRLLKILIWILLFFALIVLAAFFLPSKIYVEREQEIEARPQIVFNQINDLHSWMKWSKWNMIDPEMTIKYDKNGVGEGAGYQWQSKNKNVGNGSLWIRESVKYDSIVVEMDFGKGNIARSRYLFAETQNGTHVNWNFSSDAGYNPFARWMGLLMNKFIGPDFEEGLENLNVVCKIQSENKTPQVELSVLNEFNFVSIREKIPQENISLQMGNMYAKIMQLLTNNNLSISGMSYSVYHSVSSDSIDLECGIPVNKITNAADDFLIGVFEKQECAMVSFFGDYSQLEIGHTAVQEWMEQHKFKLAGSPIEIYVTDPGTEPNPEKWQTNIYYPIR